MNKHQMSFFAVHLSATHSKTDLLHNLLLTHTEYFKGFI